MSLVKGNVQYDIGNLYQPLAAAQTATDTFTYTVSDTAGATSTATVSMTVTGVNDAPVTVDDVAAIQEDFIVVAKGNVLSNDSDIDQGTALTVTNAGTYTGQYGTLKLLADGSYSYTVSSSRGMTALIQSLRNGQSLNDVFTYTASDGIVGTPGKLTTQIVGANDAPDAVDDFARATEDQQIASTGRLLANDTDVDAGTVLKITNAGTFAGTYGTLTLGANGSFSYVLDNALASVQALAAGQTATEKFAYSIIDDDSVNPLGDTAYLNVSINGQNDAPILVKALASKEYDAGTQFSYQIDANAFHDIDNGDVLSYSTTMTDGSAMQSWLHFDAATRTFSGTAVGTGDANIYNVRVVATDKSGAKAYSDFALNVLTTSSSHMINGANGDDTLSGTSGTDILQGAAGADTLTDTAGNNLFNGGAGADTLKGGNGNELFIGGTGNDTITTGNGADVIAFNLGDGQDIVNAGTGQDNTLSLGKGITYADLLFKKSNNDLILATGISDQITFKDWYADVNNHSVANLQVMIEGTSVTTQHRPARSTSGRLSNSTSTDWSAHSTRRALSTAV